LSDFGLSKVIGMISLTQTQDSIALRIYVARAVEDLHHSATDVYSLAVVTYELLFTSVAFDAKSDLEMTLAHVEQPQRPSGNSTRFPAALESVLLRGLVKDPSDRYPSAGSFIKSLRM